MEELDLDYSYLVEKLQLTTKYIEELDSVIPAATDYLNMGRIARCLKMNPRILIAALARQEPPIPDDHERDSAYEDFARLNGEPVSEFEVLELAAQIVGHTEPLGEADLGNMKLALKMALAIGKDSTSSLVNTAQDGEPLM